MKNFGFAGYDRVIYIGTNGKMSDAAAAMGLSGLENLPDFIAVNQRNHHQYRSELADVPGLVVLEPPPGEASNFHYVVAEVDEEAAGLGREQLIAVLAAEGVLARRYFWPGIHRMEPYRSYYPNACLLLPHTEGVAGRVVVLPTGTAVGTDEVASVCGLIRFAVAHGCEITTRLSSQPLEVYPTP